MKTINATNIVASALFTASLLIFAFTMYFIFNIKVLTNWDLILPPGEIHSGATVVLQSNYTKLRDVSGESVRYIECQNVTGTWVRYELNRATSNRGAGRGGTGVILTVRRDIADLPTRCKFTVAITYDVLPFRKVHVSNSTKIFTLLPAENASAESPTTTRNSQSLNIASTHSHFDSHGSYTNSTQGGVFSQSESEQVTYEPYGNVENKLIRSSL